MPVQSIVDDYILAAMLQAKGTRTESGTLVLTVPDFPGIIACGADARQAFDELYRLLDNWIQVSLEKRYPLPVMASENGAIDLSSRDGRALAMYHKGRSTSRSEPESTYIGGPEEFEAFLEEIGRTE